MFDWLQCCLVAFHCSSIEAICIFLSVPQLFYHYIGFSIPLTPSHIKHCRRIAPLVIYHTSHFTSTVLSNFLIVRPLLSVGSVKLFSFSFTTIFPTIIFSLHFYNNAALPKRDLPFQPSTTCSSTVGLLNMLEFRERIASSNVHPNWLLLSMFHTTSEPPVKLAGTACKKRKGALKWHDEEVNVHPPVSLPLTAMIQKTWAKKILRIQRAFIQLRSAIRICAHNSQVLPRIFRRWSAHHMYQRGKQYSGHRLCIRQVLYSQGTVQTNTILALRKNSRHRYPWKLFVQKDSHSASIWMFFVNSARHAWVWSAFETKRCLGRWGRIVVLHYVQQQYSEIGMTESG